MPTTLFAGPYIIPKRVGGVFNPCGWNDWYAAVKVGEKRSFKYAWRSEAANAAVILVSSTVTETTWDVDAVITLLNCVCTTILSAHSLAVLTSPDSDSYLINVFVVEPAVQVGELWRPLLQDKTKDSELSVTSETAAELHGFYTTLIRTSASVSISSQVPLPGYRNV